MMYIPVLLAVLVVSDVPGHSVVHAEIVIEQRIGLELFLPCPSAKTFVGDLHNLVWYNGMDEMLNWTLTSPKPVPVASGSSQNLLEFNEDDMSLYAVSATLDYSGDYVCQGWGQENMTKSILFEDRVRVIVNDVPTQPPGQPLLVALSAHTLRIEWTFSISDNNSPIEEYIILLRTTSQSTWDDAKMYSALPDNNVTDLTNLWPFTAYQSAVAARNKVGRSPLGEPSEVVPTLQAPPSSNAKPRIANTSHHSTAIYIEFSPPPNETLNGILRGYELMHRVADSGTSDTIETDLPNPKASSYNFTGLRPHTPYILGIKVYNDVGDGPAQQIVLWTAEGVPSKPRITNIPNRTSDFIQVEWERPTEINGQLKGYTIYWTFDRTTTSETIWTHSRADMMTYTIKRLQPYTGYDIQVVAFTNKGPGEKSSRFPGLTDVRGPSAPTVVSLTSNSSNSMRIEWTVPEVFYKQIDHYQIRYKPVGSPQPHKVVDVVPEGMNRFLQEAKGSDLPASNLTEEYTIGNLKSNIVYEVQVAGATRSIFYTKDYIGDFSEPKMVELRAGTPGPTKSPPADYLFTVGVIAGTSIVCVAILLFIPIFFMRRCIKQRYSFIPDQDANHHKENAPIIPETYATTNISTSIPNNTSREKNDAEHQSHTVPVSEWAKHVAALHADGDLGFSQEYEAINQNTRVDLTSHHTADPENKFKNRYINIVAYDHSRVVLKQLPGKPKQTDYINANYVDAYHKPKAYIAAQGPLPATYADFWRMVWEQNTTVICMITNLTERGRRKCDQYWPTEAEVAYQNISVKLINTYTMAHYTVRVFNLRNLKAKKRSSEKRGTDKKGSQKGCGERVVVQYHYTDWPDHGVPDFTLPVLQYVRKSAAASPEDAGPIIVHCSAGVGRTGTYIVLDSMMRRMKDKQTVNAYGFLSHIRNFRNYLVQTEDQYIFIHDALLEYIQSGGNTEVKDSNLALYLESLVAESATSPTVLEKQYLLVTSFQPKDYHLASSMMPVNEAKNRSKNLLPVELSRVRLPVQPGEEGSDYINASYLQGYNKNEEYIVTQHPLQSTVSDFWRMVWDKNSMTVVLLSETDAEDYVEFWPSQGETMDCGNFKVTFSEESGQDTQVTRDFILQSTQDDYECTTRMIYCPGWPDTCSPLSAVFELAQTVTAWHQQHQEVEGPIIVVDRLGGTEASTFCALSTLFDQLHHEGAVDVYMVAKLYHIKRPGIFPQQEHFHRLYKAIDSICEDSATAGDRDSGIANCANYSSTVPNYHVNSALKNVAARQETTM